MHEPNLIKSWRKGDFGRLAIFDTDHGLLLMTEREWAKREAYGDHGAHTVEVGHAFSDHTSTVLVPAELVGDIEVFITEPVSYADLGQLGEAA